MTTGARATVTALTVAAALALAACSGGTEPIVTETPTGGPTLSPESSSTPSPSVAVSGTGTVAGGLSDAELLALMPPGADRPDVQGAVVTAQFFLEQYAPMFHTGDTSVWDALSGPTCGYCSDASTSAADVRDRGWQARGGELEVAAPPEGNVGSSGEAYVVLPVQSRDAILISPDGETTTSEVGARATFTLKLEVARALWRVAAVMVDPS